jgi:hypothetical protein
MMPLSHPSPHGFFTHENQCEPHLHFYSVNKTVHPVVFDPRKITGVRLKCNCSIIRALRIDIESSAYLVCFEAPSFTKFETVILKAQQPAPKVSIKNEKTKPLHGLREYVCEIEIEKPSLRPLAGSSIGLAATLIFNFGVVPGDEFTMHRISQHSRISLPVRSFLIFLSLVCGFSIPTFAADPPKAPGTDVIVFTNGDQLTGKLLHSSGDTVLFNSDIAGDIKVDWAKIKELRSTQQFAVIEKGKKVSAKKPDTDVPQGTITATGSDIKVQSASAPAQTIAVKNTDFIVDEATFQKELHGKPSFFHGWDGSIAAGAALVEATQNSQNFNVGLALIRVVPNVDWLSPRNRTTANFTDIYGKVHQPGIPDTKTSIYHADAERDEYFSPRFYALANVSFDHNYSQGLDLQQIYGAGFGYTVIKQKLQELDAKADIHYEHQSFTADPFAIPVLPAQPSTNLVGSTFGEAYWRKLPAGLLFNEVGTVNISYNDTNAWSSNVAAGLVFPVYKRFSFNLGVVDSYLNNPPSGFKSNSFQFTAGLGYTFH